MKYGQGPPPSGGWKALMPGDGSDPDYSPAYQDEYQRLWHEAAARAEAAERLAEQRGACLREIYTLSRFADGHTVSFLHLHDIAAAGLSAGKETSG